MSENKWTQGPWVIHEDGLTITDDSGRTSDAADICYANPKENWTDLGDVPEYDDCFVANVQLIAAAPDLYEALEIALGRMQMISSSQEFNDLPESANITSGYAEDIKKALSKARGEKS